MYILIAMSFLDVVRKSDVSKSLVTGAVPLRQLSATRRRRVGDAIVAKFAIVAEFPKESRRIRQLVSDAESVTRQRRSATQIATQIGDVSVTQNQCRIGDYQ